MKHDLFEQKYNEHELPFVAFNSWWFDFDENGIASYVRATAEPIAPGQIVKSYDLSARNRILLIGSRVGTFVVADYRDGKSTKTRYRLSFPAGFPLVLRAAWGLTDFPHNTKVGLVLGVCKGVMKQNIGMQIETLFRNEIPGRKDVPLIRAI